MGATLDGMVLETGAVFEAKFMLPWSFPEEGAIEKHMAQVQHNMWVTNTKTAVLSVITGGGIAGEDDLDAPDLNGRSQAGESGSVDSVETGVACKNATAA